MGSRITGGRSKFDKPAYLPCMLGVDLDRLLEQDERKRRRVQELSACFPSDLLNRLNVARDATERVPDGGGMRWRDEWGTGWHDDGFGAKTDAYPLMDGYEGLQDYEFPDPQLPKRFDAVDARLEQRGGLAVRLLRRRLHRRHQPLDHARDAAGQRHCPFRSVPGIHLIRGGRRHGVECRWGVFA